MALVSCSQEEVDRYDTSLSALNIGFDNVTSLSPDAVYNYSETTTERAIIFYARISGMPVDHDREFHIEAVGGDIDKAGETYRFDTYVIPAGEVSGQYNLYFDPSKLSSPLDFESEDGELVFKLVTGETFAEGAFNHNELHVTLKNALTKPRTWDQSVSFLFPTIKSIFGDYSREKFQFMIEQGCPVNFKIATMQTETILPDPDVAGAYIISQGYANYLKMKCIAALDEYNDAHPTAPLSDSYGNPIYF